jgi:hypothetical protein
MGKLILGVVTTAAVVVAGAVLAGVALVHYSGKMFSGPERKD